MTWLSALPVCTVPVVVALALAAESGLLIGLVLPGSSLVIGFGILAGAGLVPVPVAAMTAAGATVTGTALGHRRAARSGTSALLPTRGPLGRLLPSGLRDLVDRSASPWADALARRPVRMAAAAQLVTGSRTLAPRVAARAGLPLSTMLRGTVPAALLWSCGLVALGAVAGTAATRVDGVAALAGLPVLAAVTWFVLRRRGGAAASSRPRRASAGWGRRLYLSGLAAVAAVLAVVGVVVLPCCVTDAHATEDQHASVAQHAAPPTPGTAATDTTPTEETGPLDEQRVLREIQAAAAGAGGSITAVVLDADGRPLVTAPDAATPVFTASLVKVLVVTRLLALDAAGAVVLTDEDRALMRRAIVSSDDAAMNILWTRHDGARLVRDIAATVPLTCTRPPDIPGEWGQAITTAADVATLLAALEQILQPADAAILLGWMRSATATAADGFDQRYGLWTDSTGATALKQGWMCCIDDRRYLHSAGVLDDGRSVVLLGNFPAATTWGQAAAALSAAAGADDVQQ